MFAAARLSHLGYRTLVVERLDKLGGRASSTVVDGFIVNDGAIGIEVGGIVEETFREVGAEFSVREPSKPYLYRIGATDMDVSGGGWGLMLKGITRQGARLLAGFGAARSDDGALPDAQLSTADWLSRYTKNETMHGMFRNMCGSIFAAGSNELPARLFLTYFTRKSAFKHFGFSPNGTIGLWRSLAQVIMKNGGDIWLSSEVSSLNVDEGRVTSVSVQKGDKQIEVGCQMVVSDVGPAATIGLIGEENLPSVYVELIHAKNRPTSMISINFASEDRLMEAPGLLMFSKSRRLTYVANFTDCCPELAPDGWNLYVGSSVTQPSVGHIDESSEIEMLQKDLQEQIPGFEKARILSTVVMRDDWPPSRAVAGNDMPRETPLENLWNVGDGVKEYANAGTSACAETAKLVVAAAAARYPLATFVK